MKLIFLYGAPAVGKLTIAKILRQKTNYKLLHNHLLQNPVSEIFTYENILHITLVREFRVRILEEAAKNNLDLLVTFGVVGNNPFQHIDNVIHAVEKHKGQVYLVHLTASKETILSRVENKSRKDHKKDLSKEKLEELILKNPGMFDKYPKREHLSIDTSTNTPEQSAQKIENFYNLL